MAPKKIKLVLNSERYLAGRIHRIIPLVKVRNTIGPAWGVLLAPGWGLLTDLGAAYSSPSTPNTWTTDPQRAAQGYHPALIIPLHENELGPVIAHREAYILNYQRWNVPYPVMMMTWGESYHYLPEEHRR